MQFILCSKQTCPKKETCYRYMALVEEGEYHVYDEFPALCHEEDNYKLHIKIRDGDKIRELKIENKEEKKEGINLNENLQSGI